ncbi:extracellular solute-binding protein [Bifidobacterium amazonense]|uniref:Extracellular solute-binding protein n=1 Tax=Bifidobacterium amazonense TaxID=2809027 RepID=A0ABS9VXM3_9BIFI|nr:sugar ABC transporter substrate-binding protein [Bifidobacterium amazonense]MCH9276656.1 extracellular solute-binding protein [Bifidobacterium amazonense]
MRKTWRTALVAAATSFIVALSGCSMGAPTGSSQSTEKPKEITVWLMAGDLSDDGVKAINDEFTKETGVKVNLQTQEWGDIVTKVTTALSTSTPPDLIDMGNTQVAGFAASGGLMDLTSKKDELANGKTWLKGLEDPATVDGKLYAVPFFGASRVVIYNKKMWADAGITAAPTTFDELEADLDKVAAQHKGEKDFAPFYMPGKYWYAALQFIWGAGGDIAKKEGGTWKGSASDAKTLQGIKEWKAFQNKYSTEASRSLDEGDQPTLNQVLGAGKASAILNNSVETVAKNSDGMTVDDFGTFAMPAPEGGTQPSMIAGSDWGIAAKSKNQEYAYKWLKIATSDDIQEKYVYGSTGWLPNSTELVQKIMNSSDFPEYKKGFFEAALNSKATPNSPNWTTIEGDQSINELFGTIATGNESVEAAAKDFDQHADEVFAK